VTRQADPFCTGNEQRSFQLLGFSLRRYGKNDYVSAFFEKGRNNKAETSVEDVGLCRNSKDP